MKIYASRPFNNIEFLDNQVGAGTWIKADVIGFNEFQHQYVSLLEDLGDSYLCYALYSGFMDTFAQLPSHIPIERVLKLIKQFEIPKHNIHVIKPLEIYTMEEFLSRDK